MSAGAEAVFSNADTSGDTAVCARPVQNLRNRLAAASAGTRRWREGSWDLRWRTSCRYVLATRAFSRGESANDEQRQNTERKERTIMKREQLRKNSPETAGEEELTSAQLQGVSGGAGKKGDNAFVQVVVLAAKAAFYGAQFYAAQGWTDSPPITPK